MPPPSGRFSPRDGRGSMKIRKLEIQGFKSFVDRTVLTFDHDITVVVGPNGCGKSNTVDAIRWCMGEQSAKHLRGKAMEDVIFAGSESRPAHSFAEVTLTFDNRDGLAPPEYAAFEEIAVTRKLTRDGASDYLINKTPVRLLDVVNLFLGTGAGTKAYSIVEQGRIGLIVTSKSEDRRALLEEAAGITRFKARKKSAERKIELTRQNLLRVSDILAEIEKSLDTLKRQAQKAERYKRYKSELRDVDLYVASHRLLELVALSKRTQHALDEREAEHAGVAAALARADAESVVLRSSVFEVEQVLEEAQRASFLADTEVTRLHAEIQRVRDLLDAAQRRESDARAELADVGSQRGTLEAERTQVAADLVALEQDESGASSELLSTEDHVRAQREGLFEVEARLALHRQAVVEAERSLASAEASRNALARRLMDAETIRARLESEQKALTRRLDENANDRSAAGGRQHSLKSEHDEIGARLAQTEQDVASARTERETIEQRLSDVRNERDRTGARLQALREVSGRHEGVGQGVRAALEGGFAGVEGLLSDTLAVPSDLAPAVAAVLADRWQDVLVGRAEDAVGVIERLRTEKRGRAAMVTNGPPRGRDPAPHPAMPGIAGMLFPMIGGEGEVPGPLCELLRPVVLADTLDAAVAAWRANDGDACAYRYVTRDGDVLEPSGRIVGGTPEQAGAGMLATHAEIRDLEPRVAFLEEQTAELIARLEVVRQSVREGQRVLDETRADLHAQELALLAIDRDIQSHQTEDVRVRARLETLAREVQDAVSALDQSAEEDRQLGIALVGSEARKQTACSALALDEAEASAWRERVDAGNATLTDAKVVAARARERATAARNAIARLERSAMELGGREDRLSAELDSLTTSQRVARENRAGLDASVQSAVAIAQVQQDALRDVRVRYDGLRLESTEAEARARDIRERREGLAKTVAQLELRHREEALAIEHLIEGVAEKHSVVLTQVVGEFHMRPAPDDSHRERVDELRGLIERMGEVNLMAIEEFASQEKRFNFFHEQRADLERALTQLEDAIGQMNRESKKRFKETFEAVNENFQKLFPRLFKGGRGSLQLSNPDDMLDTGVDIVAQPPGKKLVHLEAMSGGEKTLTAVTLLFALFMYKPSPFCLLDEVEAALDEANVIRWADLVRDLTDRSQFIIITHNKRTMSMADVLYGVTMQEPGVSKLVSVKLKKNDDGRVPVREPTRGTNAIA